MNKVYFGVFIPPEGKPFEELKKQAIRCDNLGYYSLWTSDHLLGMYETTASPRFECWTLTTALAMVTKKIMISQLTLANPFRNPALLAKMAATIDVISNGRSILSIGAGWHEGEFNAYGYDFGTWKTRLQKMDEAAEIIKLLWNEEKPSFNGKYYTIKDAYCNPKPLQNPMPLMIAGGGEKRTLKTVAKHGDLSNYSAWTGTPKDFKEKTAILNKHCEKVGRDPEEIQKTWAAFTFIDENQEKAEETAKKHYAKSRFTDEIRGLVGSPETIAQQIRDYIDAGASHFILSFLGGNWEKQVDLFAREVVPEFQ